MPFTLRRTTTLASTALVALALSTFSQTLVDPTLTYDTVVTGLSQPINMVFLGPNEFLVTEKASGNVKHVLNGVVTGVVLSLPVNFTSERGVLGITLDPGFTTNGYVYIYFSNADTLGGTWLDNRVRRYTWNGTALVNPSGPLILFAFDASQPNGPNHNGGVIKFGPDGKLYGVVGELNRRGLEENISTGPVSNVGGMFRINSDGSYPADNPFAADSRPSFQRLIEYGLRNSFGFTWDSKTGMIWDTENGDTTYDEINLVTPGMNSGWIQIQGPLSRNSNGLNTLYTIQNAHYEDPKFSWLNTIAPTAIAFLHSAKFAAGTRDQCVIGDNNTGQLYMFPMNADRDGFALTGGLADLVADTAAERDQVKWGAGWSIVTDLKIGPDGNLWVVSLGLGKVFRIRPINPPSTLSGKVSLDTYAGSTAGIPLTIQLKTGSTIVETLTTSVGAFGEYYVSPLSTGTFDVVAKPSHWLATKTSAVGISGDVTLDLAFPTNGDENGDNTVNLLDLSTALANFGGPGGDLNGDGTTNLLDLSLVLHNFNQTGQS